MHDIDEKILNSLSYHNEMNMGELLINAEYYNRNYLVKAVDRLEEVGLISSRKDGRERLIKKNLPLDQTKKFVVNYGRTLKNYSKIINDNLKQLEKNLPLVPKDSFPMKKIKIRNPVLELDKKTNIYTFQGKTEEGHAYTWKTRAKPLRYFNAILNALSRLYQDSSAISFSEFIADDPTTKNYQKESKKLIKDTLSRFEQIFKKDLQSWHYARFNIQNALYGLIHQIMLDEEKSKSRKLFSKVH